MRSNLPIFASLRIVLAIVFGFMSLEHGPVMAFAHARAAMVHNHVVASNHSLASGHGHGHHAMGAGVQDQWAQLPLGSPTICYAAGCFVTMASPVIGAPATNLTPLGKLVPARARRMVPTPVEPADPPPRLSV